MHAPPHVPTLSPYPTLFRSARAGHDFAPDVVHANDANTLVPALAIRALSPTPVGIIYDSHELWRHRNVRPGRLLAPLVEHLTEAIGIRPVDRSEEHTSELQSRGQLVCRLLLEKKQRQARRRR